MSDDPIRPRYEHDEREEPRRRRSDQRAGDDQGGEPREYVIVSPSGEPLRASQGDLESVAERAAEKALDRAAKQAAAPEAAPQVDPHLDPKQAKRAADALHRAHWKLYVGDFWSGDLGLTLLSISFVVEIFVITPMRDMGVPGRIFFHFVVAALMISAGIAGSRSRVWKAILVTSIFVTGAVTIAGRLNPSITTRLWGSALTSLTLLLFVHVVLVVMFRGGPITWSRIQGAVSAYFLVGMAFASAYEFVETRTPGSFQFMVQPLDLDQLSARMTYYSFSVLTTVGSPITTTDSWARSLTTAEAIIGQLFPTMLIGALVAMAIQSRPKPPAGS